MAAKKRIPDVTNSVICEIDGWQTVGGHVEYKIQCERVLDEQKWTIKRRYKDFLKLNEELSPFGVDLNLPPKKLFGNLRPQFVEERKAALQVFLDKVTLHPLLYCSAVAIAFLSPPETSSSTELHKSSLTLISNNSSYVVARVLECAGWRYNKFYHHVLHVPTRASQLFIWSNYGPDFAGTPSDVQNVLEFLKELHCLFFPETTTTLVNQYGIGVVRQFKQIGSLRDQIYGKNPEGKFMHKYSMNCYTAALNLNNVRCIARQVLEALLFLRTIGIPYFNIHCGNVFIHPEGVELAEVEFAILGHSSFNRPAMIRSKHVHTIEDMMVYNFGQFLYEMITGALVFPDHAAEAAVPKLPVIFQQIIRDVFLPTQQMPSLLDLSNCAIFTDVPVVKLNRRSIHVRGFIKAFFDDLCNGIESRFKADKAAYTERQRNEHFEHLIHSDTERERRKDLVLAALKVVPAGESALIN